MRYPLVLLLLTIILFTRCQHSKVIFDETHIITADKWFVDSVATFSVCVNDTNRPYDIFLTTANSYLYNFQNLYLFVSIQFPHNIERIDTINCYLANNMGKWYGKKHHAYYNQTLIYHRKINFPYSGNYTFAITQAMRQNPLEGIHAIGLAIEESKESESLYY